MHRHTDPAYSPDRTRADLIDSGALVEAPAHLAREAGWKVPVALTRAAYTDAVAWNQLDGPPQDQEERWWDVLWMAIRAARAGGSGPRPFTVCRVPDRPGSSWESAETPLVLTIGPGDAAEPVITVMTLEEG